MKFDVVIAGGGPAGLSAALIFGRCLRRVLVCDENQQRNRASQGIHGLLGREGKSPLRSWMKQGRNSPGMKRSSSR